MELGWIGKQVVIISKLAFGNLHFEGFETADKLEYYIKRKARDEKAREDYMKGTRKDPFISNDLFVTDIIRREIKDGDSII